MHVIWGLQVGGAERVIQKLSLGLKIKGHNVHVLSFKNGGLVQKELESAGVKVHIIQKKSRFDFSILWKTIRLFKKQIWQNSTPKTIVLIVIKDVVCFLF